ncbi:MAG: ATP-binding protein [Planctomycetota bacterium]|nr:MAG: ATP-binding protein [Planctomycetota bacterium]
MRRPTLLRPAKDRSKLLRVEDLRWTCPPSWVQGAGRERAGVDPLPDLIGQERALQALEMGLMVQAAGYNVFVSGLGGAEPVEEVRRLMGRLRRTRSAARDHVYVHNFQDPLRPQHLSLPPGGGPFLRMALRDWVRALQREIPRLLESEEHQQRRRELRDRSRTAEKRVFQSLARRVRGRGLSLVEVEEHNGRRYDLYLDVDGQAVPPDSAGQLPPRKRLAPEDLRRRMRARERLLGDLELAKRRARRLSLQLLRDLQKLDEERARVAVSELTEATRDELAASGALALWLEDCGAFALTHLDLFRRQGGAEREEASGAPEGEDEIPKSHRMGLEVFEVNVVRSTDCDGCPTVLELHPNYSNLFGTVERRVMDSGPGHYHLAVRPGSLMSADGGFLILNARDVFKEAEVWRALKRTLQNQRLEVHALDTLSPLGATGVRPEPVSLDLKVVLIGDNELYEMLHESDFDFPRIFKVKAEFDDTLPLEKAYVQRFVRAIRELGRRERLLPFAASGLAALVERAVRDAGRRNRLSARISALADYARESSYFARRARRRAIDRRAVEEAQCNFRRQHSLEAEQHNRLVLENVYEIATGGRRVGTVNALTVVTLGPLDFGRVARVSAGVSVGEESYLSVEREVELSGPIHSKGVLLLESFMRGRFGQIRTLPIKVALTFDQAYGPIDGDSASSTEVYALLSAVGRLPVRQDLAVTGAVSMDGEILAVGSVNEKVEGFFELCARRGLTGSQGVILPASNREDLMLDGDVLKAVKDGRFHVYAVETVDEGIALLTGMEAGARGRDGRYPIQSVMGQVEARLEAFEKALKGDRKLRWPGAAATGASERREAARPRRPTSR